MLPRLIVGCGYLGRRVARHWVSLGHSVIAVTRSAARAGQLRQDGLIPYVADVTDRTAWTDLPPVDTVLWAVARDRQSPMSPFQLHVEGISGLVTRLPQPRRLVLISSTGVYGQSDGSWVDETSECAPATDSGQAYLEAEGLLLSGPWRTRTIVLRSAGIYGPDRIPNRESASARLMASSSDGGGWLNLIHVSDLTRIVAWAADRVEAPDLFNVSDGCPVLRHDYYGYLVDMSASSETPDSPGAKPPGLSGRAGSNKRIQSRKLLERLDFHLEYPHYTVGLRAIEPPAP